MRRVCCNASDFSSCRRRRAALFSLIAQLEFVLNAEESHKNSLPDDLLGSHIHDSANRRIALLDSAIDTLLAVYPSVFEGVPF